MTDPHPSENHRNRPEESIVRGGLVGVALVTAATVALAGIAGLIAAAVSLLVGP